MGGRTPFNAKTPRVDAQMDCGNRAEPRGDAISEGQPADPQRRAVGRSARSPDHRRHPPLHREEVRQSQASSRPDGARVAPETSSTLKPKWSSKWRWNSPGRCSSRKREKWRPD